MLAALCAAVLLLWLLTGVLSYTRAQHEAEELMDGSLAQTARLLLAILGDNEDDLAELAARLATVRGAADNVYEPPLEFQIGRGDGTILARSDNAPPIPVLGVAGYSDILRQDTSWRVLNRVSADGRYRVQVSQSIGLRDRAALEVAGQTVLPLAVIAPLLVLFIYLSIVRGLRPLERLAAEVSARSPDNLQPLAVRNIPTEAAPLAAAIDRLLQRVGRALDNERRFTADAAHELRTPLAAVKVQTQVARRSREADQRDHALEQIECGVDRASRLVDQLLRLARLDPMNALPHAERVDLRTLVEEAVATALHADPAEQRSVRCELPEGDLHVVGDADLLQIALRNLLDNALRYTPVGSHITVVVQEAGGDLVNLLVRDDGPGVSVDVLGRLGERFFRGAGQAIEGNGLGLAIVARIAELHGARMRARNLPGGGFEIGLTGLRR
ncbi:two-component sensor histidine kinase [Pseudothauera rhizosphaerae]|uniref:histidine kinase n=1 Tax=Pseudothauera rhizosphaerae TaxID=2565932 RepID=A0A4S4AN48_9RHOO|nr:two-component sensor histidine kinase [Pseudothauera rhizosphaerae]